MSNPTSPVQTRDIRSAAHPFKRDRDNASKWAYGVRSLRHDDYYIDSTLGLSSHGSLDIKVRPGPQRHNWKLNSNKSTKANPTLAFEVDSANHRMARKSDAINTARDETNGAALSRSLLELLPQYASNTELPVQSISAESSIMNTIRNDAADEGVLYSFDNKKSPGKEVALGGLVDMAEEKWKAKETDRLVKMEYAVVDREGEVVGKRGKMGPGKLAVDEDDDFEIVDRFD